MSSTNYSTAVKVLHWLTSVTILGLIAFGWYMAGLDPEVNPEKYDLYPLHKSFGLLAFDLGALFIIFRIIKGAPALPSNINQYERMLAKVVQYSMYVLILLIPASGYIMSVASGRAISFFGVAIPSLLEKNQDLATMAYKFHTVVPYVLLSLIVLHVVGAIKHKLDGNDVLNRML